MSIQGAPLGEKTRLRRGVTARMVDARFDANHMSTRRALIDIRAVMERDGFEQDVIGRVEIALAELFNNIAEHAYRDEGCGEVRCTMGVKDGILIVEVTDQGGPMPGGEIPEGSLPNLDVSTADMPEGGFGWFLILSQAHSISHHRLSLGNCTRLNFDLSGAALPPGGHA